MNLSPEDLKAVRILRDKLEHDPTFREYWERQASMKWDVGGFARHFVLLALMETASDDSPAVEVSRG